MEKRKEGKDTVAFISMEFSFIGVSVGPCENTIALLITSNPIAFVLAAISVIISSLSVHQAVLPFASVSVSTFPTK